MGESYSAWHDPDRNPQAAGETPEHEQYTGPRVTVGAMGMEVKSSDLVPDTGNIMETARSPSGSPVMGRPANGKDTVEIQGQRVSLDVAASLGIVQRTPNGGFEGPFAGGTADPAGQGDQPQSGDGDDDGGDDDAEDEGAIITMDDEAEEVMTEVLEAVPQGTFLQALDRYMATGELTEEMAEKAAKQSGIPVEELHGKFATLEQGFSDSVQAIARNEGVTDVEGFLAFVGARNGDAREATFELVHVGSGRKFKALAREFKATQQGT